VEFPSKVSLVARETARSDATTFHYAFRLARELKKDLWHRSWLPDLSTAPGAVSSVLYCLERRESFVMSRLAREFGEEIAEEVASNTVRIA
jgi:hypothetical protein